tara:strand:- start:588 stop:1901 length:1314 start_codon:yes stop_codon:yes gene_type:complete
LKNNNKKNLRKVVNISLNKIFFSEMSFSEVLECQRYELINSDERDKKLANKIFYTVVRRLGHIDLIIDRFIDISLKEKCPEAQNILRMGISEIVFLRTPSHAAVHQTVELASGSTYKYRSLINAVLRNIIRKKSLINKLIENPLDGLPIWIAEKWATQFSKKIAILIAKASIKEPPLDISCSSQAASFAAKTNGLLTPGGTVRLNKYSKIENIIDYKKGYWWIQDIAATLPAKLLMNLLNHNNANTTIIDLCAAPGGKTAQLCNGSFNVISVEKSEPRISLLKQNLERLKLNATIVKADAKSWEPATPPQGILIDAPCSGTGTIRRNPDIVWKKKPQDIKKLSDLQKSMIERSVKNLPIGGILVYAVCSLENEEGIDHAKEILFSNKMDIVPVKPEEMPGIENAITKEGFVQTLPFYWSNIGGMDGFFICRFVKKHS